MSIPPRTPPVDKEQAKLLAHLHAAGGRPVSFEELRSLGIENPAVLCYELDLVGVPVTRVYHYPAPGRAVPVGVRVETSETSAEAVERTGHSDGLAPTARVGRAERIATAAAGLAATRRFGRSAAGLASTRRFIRTKPIVTREPDSPAEATVPVEHDGRRAAGARAAPGLRAAVAAVGLGALLAHIGSVLDEHGPVRARARQAHELALTRARAALAAGRAGARRADPRVLAGTIALAVLAAVAVALALTGQSGGSRTSPAAVRGAVRAEGLAAAGSRRLQGAGSSSLRGGGPAARRSARVRAAASGGAAARRETQAGREHVQAGSALAATQLEARGHRLLGEGHYAEAIGDFRAALAATGQTSARCGVPGSEACLTYAYALYDLGRALRLAGKPGVAVPVLTKRLRIDNQRRTVKHELELAKREHGTGGVAAPPTPAAPSPKTPPPKNAPAPAAAPAPASTPTTTPTPPPPALQNAGSTGP
jgi:hypothetical protein